MYSITKKRQENGTITSLFCFVVITYYRLFTLGVRLDLPAISSVVFNRVKHSVVTKRSLLNNMTQYSSL